MCLICLVLDELLYEEIALKVFHLEQVHISGRERTKAEFRFMRSLQCLNIQAVKKLDTLSDGTIAISMPFMEGPIKYLVGSKNKH